VWRTLDSRVHPTRVWRTLEYMYVLPGRVEYATTKEECTLESKSYLESVAAHTPASNVIGNN